MTRLKKKFQEMAFLIVMLLKLMLTVEKITTAGTNFTDTNTNRNTHFKSPFVLLPPRSGLGAFRLNSAPILQLLQQGRIQILSPRAFPTLFGSPIGNNVKQPPQKKNSGSTEQDVNIAQLPKYAATTGTGRQTKQNSQDSFVLNRSGQNHFDQDRTGHIISDDTGQGHYVQDNAGKNYYGQDRIGHRRFARDVTDHNHFVQDGSGHVLVSEKFQGFKLKPLTSRHIESESEQVKVYRPKNPSWTSQAWFVQNSEGRNDKLGEVKTAPMTNFREVVKNKQIHEDGTDDDIIFFRTIDDSLNNENKFKNEQTPRFEPVTESKTGEERQTFKPPFLRNRHPIYLLKSYQDLNENISKPSKKRNSKKVSDKDIFFKKINSGKNGIKPKRI
ncbi:uncharacterized protein LOC143238919 [Tachypleus tridentatus]|uniref:uncharacterized protein LOC143238919 n=1 Tax=Tachypleus tridentatus TaxID=6853 RepID=UPI003FD24CDD